MKKRTLQKIAFVIAIITIICFIGARYHHVVSYQQNRVITVSAAPLQSTLYYAGVVQPVQKAMITSMADGVIERMPFHYGETVQAGQLLFTVASEKFHADYKTALMQYIKTKSDFLTNQTQLKESEFLHQNHLISDDDLKTKQTTFYHARLEMAQARESLATLLKRIDLRGYNLYDLKIEDIDKITAVLQADNGAQRLKIVAPMTGVILQPPKNESTEGELKKVGPGDQIKLGDVLAIIGDAHDIVVRINVNEFNINQLKVGQVVEVTGAAFPMMTLQGKVTGLNTQGEVGQSGIPMFPVEISVSNLTAAQLATIRMGMSVKVAINIVEGEKMIIPLHAVVQNGEEYYVKVQEAHSGKIHNVPVKLGKTTLDSVVVESNLTPGDRIVIAS